MDLVLKIIFSGKRIMSFTCLLMLLAFAPLNLTAQNNTKSKKIVSGLVVDQKGDPIIGATVIAKNTNLGTVTNYDGFFSLDIANAKAVVISYIGYSTLEINAGLTENMRITLAEDTRKLDEVVVVGYGTQKKVNLTGAISTVDQKSLNNRPLTNATQALQGVQGVYVNQAGGQPGRDAATIRIRGVGTLNDNNPLVLVDGFEFPLSDVNPNNIESISVLKDAASSAIYGSRAANGVILIKTKSGSTGKSKVEYNMYYGMQTPTYLPDVVTDPILFMQLKNKALVNNGKPADYSDAIIEEYKNGMKTDPATYPATDWYGLMYNPASVQDHNLRFSGGNEKLMYALSLGYIKQNGVLMGTGSDKYSLNFNLKNEISNKFTIGMNFSGVLNEFHESAAGTDYLTNMIARALPVQPTFLTDGRYGNAWVATPGQGVFRHPISLASDGYQNHRQQRILATIFAEYKLPANITYKINAGINKTDQLDKQFIPKEYTYNAKTGEAILISYSGGPFVSTMFSGRTDVNGLDLTLFQTLNWNGSINKIHNFSAVAGQSVETYSNNFVYGQIEGFINNDLSEMASGTINPRAFSASNAFALMSFFGRFNYNYKEKYLLEANCRYDGSSRFAKGNRWGVFPSFSAGWRLDQENFMKDIDWNNSLKIRASWGQLGNQQVELYRYVNQVMLGQDYSFGSNISQGAAITAYNDPTMSWETTTMSNIGLDAGFFKGKLNLSVELFDKLTTGILRTTNLPAQVGNYAGPIRNVGKVDNKGYEIGLSYQQSFHDYSFNIGGSLTYINNKVVDLKGQILYDPNNPQFITKEGYPINSFYLLQADGIFQTDAEVAASPSQNNVTAAGDIKYKDVVADNMINDNDRVIVGNTIPKYTYSFNLRANYKNVELSAMFQGVQDIDMYPQLNLAFPFYNGAGITKEWIDGAWTPQNTGAKLPRLTESTGLTTNYVPSTFWLQDASYLRMKNIQLSYNIPQNVLKSLKISNAKVFVNGQNLLTFSNYTKFDPEKTITKTNLYEYPSVKIYSAGINVTF